MNKIMTALKSLWTKIMAFFKEKDGVFSLIWKFCVIFIAVIVVLLATKFFTSKYNNTKEAIPYAENSYSESVEVQ